MKGLSGSFPTNPHNKPPYKISVGIGAAYVYATLLVTILLQYKVYKKFTY